MIVSEKTKRQVKTILESGMESKDKLLAIIKVVADTTIPLDLFGLQDCSDWHWQDRGIPVDSETVILSGEEVRYYPAVLIWKGEKI